MLQMLPCLVVYLHLQPALAAGKSGARKYHNISSCITICRILAKMHPHCKKLTLFRNIQIYWISCCQCIKKRLAIYSHTRSCIIHTSWARSKQMEQEQLQQKLKIVNVWIESDFLSNTKSNVEEWANLPFFGMAEISLLTLLYEGPEFNRSLLLEGLSNVMNCRKTNVNNWSLLNMIILALDRALCSTRWAF